MSDVLVIVESPAKSKKIQQLLGDGFVVKASVGHIRDLPQNSLGVDLETLAPTYEISEDKKKVVADLIRISKKCSKTVLATDADREGEAIAWHLKAALNLPADVDRIMYREITGHAIRHAIANPVKIDTNLAAAQEARRVLDRLIGYLVSPALCRQSGINLSAGRVQSVAVRMVVDREREIERFIPKAFQSVSLSLANHPSISAALDLKPFVAEDERLWTHAQAQPFIGPQRVSLGRIVEKPSSVPPRPPFTTVEMQVAAGKVFGLSSKESTQAAQKLYEQGHITYLRTDSNNLSEEGAEKMQAFLKAQGLPVAQKVVKFKSKSDAQEAHEAIRPTDPAVESGGTSEHERQLYSLIRERALLSVMPSGLDQLTKMVFVSERQIQDRKGAMVNPTYHTSGKVIEQPGWRAYAQIEVSASKDKPLPALTKGSVFPGMVTSKEEFSKPPSRFNQHTLTKTLEAAGIGRPSTYTAIIENISSRGYIVPEKGGKAKMPNLKPGENGRYIVDALRHFSFMNYKYTRGVESSLDKVAAGNMGYLNIVRPVLRSLQDDIADKLEGGLLVKSESCPGCSKVVVKRSKAAKGKNKASTFWVHHNPGDAANCIQFLSDVNNKPSLPVAAPEADCPSCGKVVNRRNGKSSGHYWMHKDKADSTACGQTFLDDKNGAPALKVKPPAKA
jgi:DNA topoisomerase-1